jgi:cytochrome d ubiquinol oxidase subunit I
MDTVALSRLQFAATGAFHFLFVPLTLGLSVLTAYMETRYATGGGDVYLKMAKFWGKLFIVNFALGVVTGITMEFQFGMNWAEYSKYVGDIFGAPLAIEATVAFFLESVFIGLWVFGWAKLSKPIHALCIWLVAFATNLSALWILVANGWMQHPVGYAIRNGRAELIDFPAVLSNWYGWIKFGHTVVAGYLVAAFFVMGISAYHLLKHDEPEFFKRSFRIAASFGLAASVLVVVLGDFHAVEVAKTQPTKFAAMTSVWDTKKGVDFSFLVIPDTRNERNSVETLSIPKFESFLAFRDAGAEIKGLKDFPPDRRPPVKTTFWSFRFMVALGFIMIVLCVIGFAFARRGTLEARRRFLLIMLFSIPLPYIAGQLGWIVSEIGRQPWIVYGMLETTSAISKSVGAGQVWTSFLGFVAIYGLLGFVDVYLLAKIARKGPDSESVAKPKFARQEA